MDRYLVLTARRAWALAAVRQGWPCANKSSVVARGASSLAVSAVAVRGDVSLIGQQYTHCSKAFLQVP